MAGIHACSVSYDGYVCGCISERAWNDGMLWTQYGNLLHGQSLQNIWENEFKDIRFQGTRKCCKDCIDFPACVIPEPKIKELEKWFERDVPGHNKYAPITTQPMTMMYAAFGSPMTYSSSSTQQDTNA
jgi:hypothetical protein